MGPSPLHRFMPTVPLAALALLACGVAFGQTLYKYSDDNGEWVYTDRPPIGANIVEVRSLATASARGTVSVTEELVGDAIRLIAHNGLYAPVEIALVFDSLSGVVRPNPKKELRWVIPPRSDMSLMHVSVAEGARTAKVAYRYDVTPGDPAAVHRPTEGYRAPFAAAADHPITQAYPDIVTHQTPDSEHAIDIAMPVGTDVLAARGGVVFDVISKNFRGGIDRDKHLHSANIVRILHDDGTMAVYAHLNWDSIRVRPGERVSAGQYIADSGNTGFSSGPHLHFAVQRNAGMHIEALPVTFGGPNARGVVPTTGNLLTAYP